jgi:hypothetical protein
MNKKIAIDFNKIDFENQLQKYDYFESCKKAIDKEVNSLLEEPIQVNEYSNCVDEFYNALELQKKEVNNLNLSPIKLAEVLERDTTRLKAMENEFRKLKPAEKPDEENFQTYAETPEEIDRFNNCVNLMKVIETFKQYGIKPNINLNRAFNNLIAFDLITNEIKYNIDFIKNGI